MAPTAFDGAQREAIALQPERSMAHRSPNGVSDAAEIRSPSSWVRLVAGLAVVFVVFHGSASVLGSDRGQAGIVVAAVVILAVLAFERLWFSPSLPSAARTIGLGPPGRSGLIVSAAISGLLLLIVPLYVVATGSQWTMAGQWSTGLPGLFAQAGIAEEVLFRGYLFGHVRRGRSFWRAASISMLPFVAVHALMFFTLPLPVALAGLLLAVIISFPMAQLYELGDATVWAPALLHFVVQGTVKSIDVGNESTAFPLVWMAASALIPLLALLVRRPADTRRRRS